MRRLASGAFLLFVLIATTFACGSDAEVGEASCQACAGKSYTEADCQRAGEAAGCESSTFVPTVAGCTNGCSFKNCRSVPECSSSPKPTSDAGGADAAV